MARVRLIPRLIARSNGIGGIMLQDIPSGLAARRLNFRALHRYWTAGHPKGNERDAARMAFLALNIAALEVPGALAELGVWRGNSAKLMHELAPDRRLYLFDTFAGFDARDVTETAHLAHFRDTSAEAVRAFLGKSRNITVVPGRFPDTAGKVPADERFAFVHLDCDLEAPIRAALAFFYPRMSPGGIVAVHDYENPRWPGVHRAVDEFLADKPESVIRIPDRAGTAAFAKVKPSGRGQA
ncbi:MAG: class I SAM-dependent methyltransferase [Acetobacteraceae bacterium]|nr:class I SAM-dependent methyltransferase [Acetobacteraceae bacterium]